MENLKLLKIHKKKTVLGHAFVKFGFIYLCILIFLFTSLYFRNSNENNILTTRVERIITIIENTDIEKQGIDKQILEGTYIYNGSGEVLSYINNKISGIKISHNDIIKIDGYKYYSTQLEKGNEIYYITTRIASNNFLAEIIITLAIIVSLAPILYFFLVWVSEFGLRKVYKPIEEIIGSLEGFAININHEFKTSLSEIISSLELANITNDYKESSHQAIDSAKRLNNTLDSLSLMIHFVNSDYRKQNVNIIKQLDGSIQDFSKLIEEKNINITKKYKPNSTLIVHIDKAPLLLCFTNILKNAIRYSSEGGNIEVHIHKKYFKIKDYGVGIESENIERIFERYFRETYAGQGTGIGLSLVKRITDTYNWDVKVDSVKGEYTEITLSF